MKSFKRGHHVIEKRLLSHQGGDHQVIKKVASSDGGTFKPLWRGHHSSSHVGGVIK